MGRLLTLFSRPRISSASALPAALGALVLLVAGSAQARVYAGSDRAHDSARGRPEAPGALPSRGAVAPIRAEVAAARRSFRARLGRFALLAVDRQTGTPRAVGRLDGSLTGPSERDARDIALDYVRARPDVFGIDGADLGGLRLVRRYTAGGLEHLRWAQVYQGIEAIDTSLAANLTPEGRLVNVLGAPRHDLAVPSVTPAVSAEEAYAAAAGRLGGRSAAVSERKGGPARVTEFVDGGSARLVIFEGDSGPRLGWRLLVFADEEHVYDAVVDATTGTLVRRQNLVAHATATIYRNYPGAPAGGAAATVNIDAYLSPGATRLIGPNAHTFADVNDAVVEPGDAPPASGEIAPSGGNWNYPLTNVDGCSPLPCVWDGSTANSWQVNRSADATQVHWFVNNFHDHLENTPAIAFTNPAGNFEDADPVIAQSMDGANTAGGFPDFDHINNANMLTLPDGSSPHMQMYLTDVNYPHYASTGFDSMVVYHEYTHGLVGRTITDASGNQAVGGAQGGAINEGTADWYAVDYLVAQGLEADSAAVDLTLAKFSFGSLRSQPIDCEVGSPASACPGDGTAGAGGYTFGDFGKIAGGPQVHADGEIWAETVWQLRRALVAAHGAATGTDHVRRLYTTGMRLAPDNPSFLDLRNAILQADTAQGLGDSAIIWSVFAQRGMGYFASTTDAGDTEPVENFATPPPPGGPTGSVTGTVTDSITNAAAVNVKVAFAGHDSGVGPELSGTTNASGIYTISDVPTGTYPLMRARGGGLEEGRKTDVTVTTGTNTHDFALRRNLASPSGGASIESFTGPDYTAFGCGPGGLIDGTQGVVWGSNSPNNPPRSGPKEVVVELAAAAQVGAVEIDPGAGCGDDDSASLKDYEIQVSTNGTTFTKVAEGRFTAADNHRYNAVALMSKPPGTRFVKLVAKSSQSNAGSGADFMDVAELRVFAEPGATAPGAPTGVSATAGDGQATVSWTAPASDGGSAITGYVVTPFVGSAPGASVEVGNVTSTQVTGLVNGTTYTFRVASRNAIGTSAPSASSNAVTPSASGSPTRFVADFDGDGKDDIAVWRPSSGTWFRLGESSGTQWGAATDVPVPGNYHGGAADELAVWRPSNGTWYVLGQWSGAQWGQAGDVPVPGDYDGDGVDEFAVWRPANGIWYVNGRWSGVQWGQAGDIPVPGNYDADLATEMAVFRPANGFWYVLGGPHTHWGQPDDIPVTGDFAGDARDDFTVFRPSSGTWYVEGAWSGVQWGQAGDVPLAGDFDADPELDRTVWRPANGTWYTQGNWSGTQWGQEGDIP